MKSAGCCETQSTGTIQQETSAPLQLEVCQQNRTEQCVFCSRYLVVVEVAVDREPVCAQTLQISGTVCL